MIEHLEFYGTEIGSRLLIGTALYPSPQILSDAVIASGSKLVTVSVRREAARARAGQGFWELIKQLDVHVLPNTAGCKTVKEAVTTAQMARELFETDWIKLEVIANDDTLQPEVFGLVEAARILNDDGFKVFPYMTEDLGVAEKLVGAGCEVL
ncbi:MAG: thiazole synthase, partial [Hyphomicrobiaceae bacterium]|nr:thiazole synthase [Hyphomicrobiaceae bacterium]